MARTPLAAFFNIPYMGSTHVAIVQTLESPLIEPSSFLELELHQVVHLT
jgi:hypothetical protein